MTRLLKQIRKSIVHTLRWHRKIGIFLVGFILLLVVTGILLNHSPDLNLSKKTLHSKGLLNWYGIEATPITGFQLGDDWLIQPGDNQLFLNRRLVGNCDYPLAGAARYQSLLLALCRDSLLLLDASGELVEQLDTVQGLPEGMTRLQVTDRAILVGNNLQTFTLDIDSLNTAQVKHRDSGWSRPSPLPGEAFDGISGEADLPGISLERLLLDVHSGRILGTFGVILVDLVGIGMAILALTGAWAWYSKRQLRKSANRAN